MIRDGRSEVSSRLRIVAVRCPRLGCMRTVEEHLLCPYCCGRTAEVVSVDHPRFCDWKPGVDPTVFGFPSAFGRYAAPGGAE